MPRSNADKLEAVRRMKEGATQRLDSARHGGAQLYAPSVQRLGAFAVDQPDSQNVESAGVPADYLEPHELADRLQA